MKFLAAFLALVFVALTPASSRAQGCGSANPSCVVPDRPSGDSTSAAANTRFVQAATGGGGLTLPLSVANGGTGAASASGTSLDNITGFSTTGYLKRTGAGTYVFVSATNALNDICNTQGAVLYNNGTNWVCLTPGTAGQGLSTGGAAANPSWATFGTVTSLICGTGMTGGTITTSGTCANDIATNTNIWSATANKIVDAAGFNGSGNIVTLTDAATIALDMSTFINAKVTLGATRILGNPSNTQTGREGCIYITNGAGPYNLTYASNWKWSGGVAPTLTQTNGALDVLCYQVLTSTFVFGSMTNNVQ